MALDAEQEALAAKADADRQRDKVEASPLTHLEYNWPNVPGKRGIPSALVSCSTRFRSLRPVETYEDSSGTTVWLCRSALLTLGYITVSSIDRGVQPDGKHLASAGGGPDRQDLGKCHRQELMSLKGMPDGVSAGGI